MKPRTSRSPANLGPMIEGAAGSGAPPPELIVETLEVDGETLVLFGFSGKPHAAPGVLTDAEWQVAELARQGLRAAQIAAKRGAKKATISSQLQSIYRKLGVHSRTELAVKLAQTPLMPPSPLSAK
ncbi:MAG: helix-turn-helix transcriptional regulator [Myxococcales bacterium]|nr:helix-turn-helix transcriptional regulator [Myxococcales bacterium]